MAPPLHAANEDFAARFISFACAFQRTDAAADNGADQCIIYAIPILAVRNTDDATDNSPLNSARLHSFFSVLFCQRPAGSKIRLKPDLLWAICQQGLVKTVAARTKGHSGKAAKNYFCHE
jgi:hypothetical protein